MQCSLLLKVDEKEFELTKDSKPPEGRPLGGKIIPELTSIDAMKKETIAAMEHEVRWWNTFRNSS